MLRDWLVESNGSLPLGLGGGNPSPSRPPREYLGEYTSQGKPKIPPADRILMDPGHKSQEEPIR